MSSRAALSKVMRASTILCLGLLAIIRDTGGQLQDAGTAGYPAGDYLDAMNQLTDLPEIRFRTPASHYFSEEEEEEVKPTLEFHKTLHFSCENAGVFAKEGSCRRFYYCEASREPEARLVASELICPETTVFDSETKTCIPSAISTRPECRRAESHLDSSRRRRKRSDESTSVNITSCTDGITENLAESSRDACVSARDIDAYISNVKAVQLLEVRSFHRQDYEAIIIGYNSDLTLTQSNYDDWRNGDSVFGVINQTFHAAKNFEPTFNSKFEENQERIQIITSEDTPDIKQMEEHIIELKREINQTQGIISILEGSSPDQAPVYHFENMLMEKESALEKLISDDARVKTEKEVAALVDFLEEVRLRVSDIQLNATESATRIESFQQKIVTDSSKFLRHREIAQKGISTMQEQRTNNELEKARIQTEINNLRASIQHEHNEISHLTSEIHRKESELREIEAAISRSERKARKKKRWGGFLRVVPVVGWIGGQAIRNNAKGDLRRLQQERQVHINHYHSMINVHRSQIATKTREIQNAESRIATLNSSSRQLDLELADFSKLDQDLAKIQTDINSILPSVDKALSSIAKLKAVFDVIRLDLDATLELAKEAKENAQEKNLLYFIYNSISDLKCKWDQASVKIIALDECN